MPTPLARRPFALVVIATALPMFMATLDNLVMTNALNSTVREIGVALGTAVMTAVFVGAGGALLPDQYVDAAQPAVFVGAAVLAVAAIAGLWLPAGRSPRRAPVAVEEPAELTPVA
jgi:hypothetical protein